MWYVLYMHGYVYINIASGIYTDRLSVLYQETLEQYYIVRQANQGTERADCFTGSLFVEEGSKSNAARGD